MKHLAAALAILSLSATGHAAEPEKPATGQEAKPEKPKKICRNETSIGSIRTKRVCRTPEEMEVDEQNAREALNRMNQNVHHNED